MSESLQFSFDLPVSPERVYRAWFDGYKFGRISGSPDSVIDIKLEPTCLGALLTLTQTGVPAGQSSRYLQDWAETCFRPLVNYFETIVASTPADMDGQVQFNETYFMFFWRRKSLKNA